MKTEKRKFVKKNDSDRVFILDTTLRDGEQSPGCSMNTSEKVRIAIILDSMGIDVIEAGFAIASPGDFEAIQAVASVVRNAQVASLSRSNEADILKSWKALEALGSRGRIHTFIATSPIHMKEKLKMTATEVLYSAVKAVRLAKTMTSNVEFSCEDAARTDLVFLAEVVEAVIASGASVVNIPDTVGYGTPMDFPQIISYLKKKVTNINEAIISVHCHNDLGMAVANSLLSIQAGARQVECTINGIGERAGNCSLEQFVMNINVRQDIYPYAIGIDNTQLIPASKMLVSTTGVMVQPNLPIVGKNAFAHEAGIHQHGILENSATYEIMTPASVGLDSSKLVLGKHSGRHAFIARLKELGYHLNIEELRSAFKRFKELADLKKDIFDEDIAAIADGQFGVEIIVSINKLNVLAGKSTRPMAHVSLFVDGKDASACSDGDGPVDAVFSAIKKAINMKLSLTSLNVSAISEKSDAQGRCVVKLRDENGKEFVGRGVDTDIIQASAESFVYALNRIISWQRRSSSEYVKETG